jgi:hypothetical protein
MEEAKNYIDDGINSLKKIRDALTPHGIQIVGVSELRIDNQRLAVFLPKGKCCWIVASIFVPLEGQGDQVPN